MAALYFLSTFLFRKYFLRGQRARGSVREELAPIISNFLFHSNSDPIVEQRHFVELKIKIRERLQSKSFRKVLSKILLDLQKDVSGKTRERLVALYRELELHNDAISKLNSWRWEAVSQGILELTQMEVQEAYNLISKYCADPRKTVRKQAEIGLVQLKKEGIKYVLDNASHPISEWQQLKLIEALGTHADYNPPPFKSWLLSGNNDVVFFALRLIQHYNQKDAEGAITELVKHKSDHIKIEALRCISDFCFQTSLPTLKKIFWRVSVEVKIQILDVLAELGDVNDLLFLTEVKERTLNHLIKSKAMGAMNSIQPDSVLPTKDILAFEGPKLPFEMPEDGQSDQIGAMPVEYEIELGDGITPIMRGEIEFTEIEVYDSIEKPVSKSKKTTTQENDEIILDFELNLMGEVSNESFEKHIGLVNTSNEEGFEKDFDRKEFEERYHEMDFEQREKLLDSVVDYGDSREKYLLESIVDLEENSELRFRAFEKLKELQHRPVEETMPNKDKGQFLPEDEQSIFCQLFDHATDEESQHLLLKEMAEVGDFKEIPFLKSLLEKDLDHDLKTVVEDTIKLIENKFLPSEVLTFEPLPKPSGSYAETKVEMAEKIPMELFSLKEEIGISNEVKVIDLYPEFELEDDPFVLTEPSKLYHNG